MNSYTNDNTLYVTGDSVKQVSESLKKASDKIFCWFANTQIKSNPGKCHLITKASTLVGNNNRESSKYEKLPGNKLATK